jgi:hypothetical protein
VLEIFKFEDSCNNSLIQLSDLVVGILRFLLTFLEQHSFEEILNILCNMEKQQKETTWKLQRILLESLRKSSGFKHGVACNTFEQKINLFLDFDFETS